MREKMDPQSKYTPESDLTLKIARSLLRESANHPWLASLLLHRKDWLTELAQRLRNLSRQTRRVFRRALSAGMAATILTAAFLWTSPARAGTGTITVDGATCSLANAITTANSGVDTGGCTGGSAGADTIDMQTDVTLYSALPLITSQVIIEGNGHTIERSSGAATNFSVLTVSSSGNLTLKQATISGGNNATLKGGGIYSEGPLTVENSTITDNNAYQGGGGICILDSTLTVKNSTITGNSTDQVGGGILAYGSSTASIENSTITGNTASMGGGIFCSEATAYIENSIFAENATFDCMYNMGSIMSLGYNIESGTYCGFTGTGDQQNVSSANLNLGSLQDNGGPTDTIALGSGSFAINKIPDGTNGCAAGTSTDQRGAARANGTNMGGSACDVGAYEYSSSQTPTIVKLMNMSVSLNSQTGIIAIVSGVFVALSAGWMGLFHRRKASNRTSD
jgi:hypothetical protein